MGTRALISKNGKPIIATHWDGNPDSLGRHLKNVKTDEKILEEASKHSIDSIDKSFAPDTPFTVYDEDSKKYRTTYFPKTDKEMIEIAKRVGLVAKNISTKDALEQGFGTSNSEGTIKLASVSDLGDNYGDWAEFQYDFKDGEWFVRPLEGSWTKDKEKSKVGFKKLKEVI